MSMTEETAPFSKEESSFVQIAGPLFLVFALALGAKAVPVLNYDLLAVAAIGLFASAKWRIRGCAYALVLLALSSIAKHLWIREHHLFQAALEGSVGFSLLICALVFDERFSFFSSLKQQIEQRSQTIHSLEADLTKEKRAAMAESGSLLERLASLQQQLEEVQADTSALQILNEVLRKSSASALEEKSFFASQMLQAQHQSGLLLEEIDSLQLELNRLSNGGELANQNRELFQELNAARFKEAQTHLVNETLARIHSQQNQRVKELEAEKENLIREAEELRREKQGLEEESSKVQGLEGEHQALLQEIEGLRQENEQTQEALKQIEAEADQLREQVAQEGALALEPLTEQLRTMSVRLEQSSNVELLYRQLKQQFEEKNELLHRTRTELFHVDTELQTLRIQTHQKQLEVNPLPPSLCKELEALESEQASLSEENEHLEELITHLMGSPESTLPKAVKKKLKTSPSLEQATLF